MKRICFALLSIALLGSCSSSERPVATLEFSGVGKSVDGYTVTFHSDIDLDTLFSPAKDEKVVTRRLICALENDHDFSVKHNLQRFFRGNVSRQQNSREARPKSYKYMSDGNFFVSSDDGGRKRVISNADLIKLIESKDKIPCKVVMTIYLSDPYYSSTFHVPSSAITKTLTEERNLPPT